MAIIGIDLGASNSAAAVLRGGRPVMIPSAEGVSLGGKAFPSYVALTADGQMLIGEPARRQAATNPEGTTAAFKRRMGRREIVRLRDREFSPEQLSAFLLQKIKRDAESFLGEKVEKVVVTVPAYFDDNQRSATKDACRIAGLEVACLVNEPTAASLAYELDRLGQELRIAVIDFDGRQRRRATPWSLDCCLASMRKGENMQTARTQDPAVVASHNYRVLLENKRMRALEYWSKPGDRTALLAHPACLVYSFCPSTIQITTSYGANAEYEFKAGEVIWMDGSAHCTENIGATDAHLLIVEFKEPPMEGEMPGIWWED